MSKKIICENHLKQRITFTHDFPFLLEKVEGIYVVSGTVTGMSSANSDGEDYLGTSVDKRNIIIYGVIKDNFIDNRNKLYKTFPLHSAGVLYYYEDDLAKKIEYYVEDIKVDSEGLVRRFQISLVSLNPYFRDIDTTVCQMATWSPKFKFSLKIPSSSGIKFGQKNVTSMATIVNESNLEYGMIITFIADDEVTNPSLFNVDTREELKIEKTMQAGDKIVVNTYRKNKNIYYIPITTGIAENINNLMVYGSKFLQIHYGSNTYRYNADTGVDNLEATIEYFNEYEAI